MAQTPVCHRCFQPLDPASRRCPACREYRRDLRRLPIVLAVAIVMALALVMLVIVWTTRKQDTGSHEPEQEIGLVTASSVL